jgi:hypothetical protein
MASTPILPFATWASGTNQNSIPANDNALRAEILQRNVNNATTAQPGSPADGDCYIIQSTHTGAQWSAFTPKDVAIYKSGSWYAFAPVEGVRVSVSGASYIYTSGAWTAASAGMTNPMTTAGDTMYGGASGTPTRLAAGAAFKTLRVNSGATAPEWGGSGIQCIPIACSDETTALTTGTAKVTFRMPFAFTLTDIRASVTTAATGGTLLTVDVNEAGTTILSTKLTFDASEKTTTTAATARVISDANLADDAEITVDIDAVGSTLAGVGLKVYLIGYIP